MALPKEVARLGLSKKFESLVEARPDFYLPLLRAFAFLVEKRSRQHPS